MENYENEEAPRESEEKYRSLVENMQDVVYRLDLEGKILFTNTSAARLLGCPSAESITGRNILDFYYHPEDAAHHRKNLDKNGFLRQYEVMLKRQDNGRPVIVNVNTQFYRDRDGTIVGIEGVYHDITERKRAERMFETLHSLILELNSCNDFRRGLEKTLTALLQLEYIDCGGIFLINSTDGSFDLAMHRGVSEEFTARVSHFPGDSPQVRMIMSEETHYMEYNDILRLPDDALKNEGLRTFVIIPILNRGQLIGMVNLGSHTHDFIPDAVRNELETIALQIGSTLARLYTEAALKESEERWQFALEGAGDGVWDWNVQTSKVFFSHRWKSMLGYEDQEIGDTLDEWDRRVHPDDKEGTYEKIEKYFSGEAPVYESEHRMMCKDGSYKWILDRGKVISRTKDGRPLRVIGTHADITKRKLAETQLERNLRETIVRLEISQALAGKETEDEVLDTLIRHAGLYPQAHMSILTFDRTGSELAVILRRQDTFKSGLKETLPTGMRFPASRFTSINYFSADRPSFTNDILNEAPSDSAGRELFRTAGASSYGVFPLTAGNDWMGYIGVTARPAGYFNDENLLLYQTLAEQGAVALRAARLRTTIRESQQRHSLMVQQSPLGVIECTIELQVVSWNPSAERIFGYTRDEATGRRLASLVAPEETLLSPDNWIMHEGGTHTIRENLTRDGRRIVCEWFCNSLVDTDGRNIGVVMLVEDITDHKRAEEALKESEEKLRLFIEHAPAALAMFDRDMRYIAVSRRWISNYNLNESDLIGKYHYDIFPEIPDQLKAIHRRGMNGEMVKGDDSSFTRTDGSVQWISWEMWPWKTATGSIGGIVIFSEDITERKRTEEALSNMQKLESLGVLAGGIAHDFNNLLAGLFGYIDMASAQTNDREVSSCLAKARGAIDRARGLTGQLLTFSKGGAPIKKLDRLIPFIEETAQFALSGSNVSCSFIIPDDLWQCEYDRNMIGRVIDNIVINAQQAMPEGGALEILAENTILAEKTHATLSGGNYVKIAVKDHGIGIPGHILPKIFDPFFTTKSKGHGLGLATCFSIIKRHGGCIEVESEPGIGSTFQIYLPAAPGTGLRHDSDMNVTHQGSGIFVVMDDEGMVRDSTGKMLASFGYSVKLKKNGEETIASIASFVKEKKRIAGMILDLTIPGGMGGKEAIVEIRKICSKTPVFVVSGYADDPVMADPADYGFTASISKPFTKHELANLLNSYIPEKKRCGRRR